MFPVTDKTDKTMSKLTFFPTVYPRILTHLIFQQPRMPTVNKTALHPTMSTDYQHIKQWNSTNRFSLSTLE